MASSCVLAAQDRSASSWDGRHWPVAMPAGSSERLPEAGPASTLSRPALCYADRGYQPENPASARRAQSESSNLEAYGKRRGRNSGCLGLIGKAVMIDITRRGGRLMVWPNDATRAKSAAFGRSPSSRVEKRSQEVMVRLCAEPTPVCRSSSSRASFTRFNMGSSPPPMFSPSDSGQPHRVLPPAFEDLTLLLSVEIRMRQDVARLAKDPEGIAQRLVVIEAFARRHGHSIRCRSGGC